MSTTTLSDADNVLPDLVLTAAALPRSKHVPDFRAEAAAFWLAHHDRLSRVSSDDARVVEQLAHQLMLALKSLEQARERQQASALLQSQHVAQRNLLAYELRRERHLREQAEASESESRHALLLKDTMIHEVNHRTKNTLQVAAVLLYMQACATTSAEGRQALLDSHGRLQLLAKVHELLCTDPDTTQTIAMPQLLETVGDALVQSFGSTRRSVRLRITSDPLSLAVEDAIAIALVTNEAVTNAYKHAFANDSAGEITVNLQRTPNDALILAITDTGMGFRRMDGNDGVGQRLLRTFATQVHGALDIAGRVNGPGTQITLTIDQATLVGPTTPEFASARQPNGLDSQSMASPGRNTYGPRHDQEQMESNASAILRTVGSESVDQLDPGWPAPTPG